MRGKERGHRNENASNLVYFASFGILAGFDISESIFRMFLDLKLVLEYFFNIKRYKNKKKITSHSLLLLSLPHSPLVQLSDSPTP